MRRASVSWLTSAAVLALSAITGPAHPNEADFAQVSAEFDQQSWRHEHGLPDDRVRCLLQTRDGYLWIGTQRGLARFDGRQFAVFDHVNTPELDPSDCRSLAEDADGNLWIGTARGAVRKAGNRFTLFDKARGARAVPYPLMCARRNGGVWTAGDFCLDWIRGGYATNYVPSLLNLDDLDARSIREESAALWIGVDRGLRRIEVRPDGSLGPRIQAEFTNLTALASVRAGDGTDWVLFSARTNLLGNVGGRWLRGLSLGRLQNGRWTKTPTPGQWEFRANEAQFLVQDPYGALWLPATQNFINRYANGMLQHLPLLQTTEEVYALCALVDREGGLWIGTEDQGLLRWTPRRITTYTTDQGLPNDNVWTISEGRDGCVWVGTDAGLGRLKNGTFVHVTRPDGTPWKNIRGVSEDKQGRLWIGTMRSLECLSGGRFQPVAMPGEWEESKVRALLPARDGAMWVGTVRGLSRWHEGKLTKFTQEDGLGGNEVRAILESRNGDIWVGTYGGGLSRLHQGRWATWSAANGLPNNNVWALYEDGEGVLWLGTENGLCRHKDGRFTAYSVHQGLPAREVNFVLEDKFGRLWIGHDKGIYWVRKKALNDVADGRRKTMKTVSYDESDGLVTLETNGQKSNPAACKTRDGRLWFPTIRGVVSVDPARIVKDDLPSIAAIEEVTANGDPVLSLNPAPTLAPKPVSAPAVHDGSLRLPPGGARLLEFRFNASTFEAPEKTRFRYRLAGLDDHWVEAGTRRQAYYSGLRPGDYRFEVIAANHHGLWQSQSTRLAFRLAPFYYQTSWFYAACGLGLAALVAAGVTWRARELRKIHRLEQVAALNEQRRQIARDIHDELGASLTHILHLTGQGAARPDGIGKTDSRRQRIAEVAETALDHIGEIVWVNNPHYDTLEDLIAYLREHAANFLAATNTHAHFDFPATVPARPVPGPFRRHLLLLVKEALQNIVKHAGAKEVRLALTLRDSSLDLLIADDGCGLPANVVSRPGNGLLNMRQRARELGGTLQLESLPGRGTEIRLRAPLPPA